jgi:hypothetical protein
MWGCYQQSLREIAARWTSLQTHNALLHTSDEKYRSKTRGFELQLSNRVREESLEELACLLGYAIVLKEAIGHVSAERRNELEFELWKYRTRVAVCRDLLTYGHPMSDTVELLHVVPKAISADLVQALFCTSAKDALLQWYFSHDVKLPYPPEDLVREIFDNLNLEVFSIESFLNT